EHMRLSQNITKTLKNAPADEQAINAKLLIRAGFIHKEMAGAYSYLPLGLRVIENIKSIVREEMNGLGATEMLMTSLQSKETWTLTGRWSDEVVDIWFKSQLKSGTELGFGWSHEEPLMMLVRSLVKSYRDLPFSVYQFQTKFRNELRAKSGVMRGREFLMKDMYAFSRSDKELAEFYDRTKEAYLRVYDRVGLGDNTYVTFASGGAFTQFSHEFQTVTDSGEDTIYLDRNQRLAVNEEVYNDEILNQLGLKKDHLEKVKAAEVGNIFNFGTLKGEQMDVYFNDESGARQPVFLSSYGIGVSRLMGVIAEHFNDQHGLIWPINIAPARIYLMSIGNTKTVEAADRLYNILTGRGVEVIYDDRDVRPGEKFSDADLMGIPWRVVVSEQYIENEHYEIKSRSNDAAPQYLKEDALVKLVDSATGKDNLNKKGTRKD
ncbi:MAG: aminoacyl--tRNA ligase-related protein, partial [Candidatus Saccharimonadales bacterium]